VRYDIERGGSLAIPAADEQYEFTCGTLSSDGKDVEFRIDVDVMRGTYFVNPTELLELKVRAAKLFAEPLGIGKRRWASSIRAMQIGQFLLKGRIAAHG